MFICIKSIIVLCKNKKENKLILFYSILIYKLKTFALMFSEPCMHEKGASREMPHGSA